MTSWTDSGLPFLAHPAYPFSTHSHGKRIPALPEVCGDWDGFCLPTMHCIGVRQSLKRTPEGRLIINHELNHWLLAKIGAPTSVWVRYLSFAMWIAMQQLAKGHDLWLGKYPDQKDLVLYSPKAKDVEVPLRLMDTNNARDWHALEQCWTVLVDMKRRAEPLEESFAIWASLNQNLMDATKAPMKTLRRDYLINEYKAMYSEYIPDFARLYDKFDVFARSGGPEHLLRSLYFLLWCFVGKEDRELAHSVNTAVLLETMAEQSANGQFVWATGNYSVDPESYLPELLPKQLMYSRAARAQWLDVPRAPLDISYEGDDEKVAVYLPSEIVDQFMAGTLSKKNADTMDRLWRESLRQQLCQGIGLTCLFWTSQRPRVCCGGWRRELLEGLLDHTTPRPGWYGWQPRGCLRGGVWVTSFG